jgi:hypothetical protein
MLTPLEGDKKLAAFACCVYSVIATREERSESFRAAGEILSLAALARTLYYCVVVRRVPGFADMDLCPLYGNVRTLGCAPMRCTAFVEYRTLRGHSRPRHGHTSRPGSS